MNGLFNLASGLGWLAIEIAFVALLAKGVVMLTRGPISILTVIVALVFGTLFILTLRGFLPVVLNSMADAVVHAIQSGSGAPPVPGPGGAPIPLASP